MSCLAVADAPGRQRTPPTPWTVRIFRSWSR